MVLGKKNSFPFECLNGFGWSELKAPVLFTSITAFVGARNILVKIDQESLICSQSK